MSTFLIGISIKSLKQQAAHSGTKCLKPTRNRFTLVGYIVISRVCKATFHISVFGKWMNFIFKIRQIVASLSKNRQFAKNVFPFLAGFLHLAHLCSRFWNNVLKGGMNEKWKHAQENVKDFKNQEKIFHTVCQHFCGLF